jgi:hypothetical protein
LNFHPEQVADPLFQQYDFFDAHGECPELR